VSCAGGRFRLRDLFDSGGDKKGGCFDHIPCNFGGRRNGLHIWLSLELIFLPARINGVAREMDWWGKGADFKNGQCLLSLRHFRFVLMIYTYVMGLLRSFQKLPAVMTLLGRLP
jgi:hypothetical protein